MAFNILGFAGAGTTKTVAGAATVRFKNPFTIRFSQDSISSTFSTGEKLSETIFRLRNDASFAAQFEPIKLVKFGNLPASIQTDLLSQGGNRFMVFSLDNRRLYAARAAGIRFPTQFATPDELSRINLSRRFTTTNAGGSVFVNR